MKVAIICALLLCVMLFGLGIVVWFIDMTFLEKIVISPLCILSSVAFTSMGIEFLRDDQ